MGEQFSRLLTSVLGPNAQAGQLVVPAVIGLSVVGFFVLAFLALEFDRAAAFGLHLSIPSSTAMRFEPGDQREVSLVPYGGKRNVYGFNNLADGPTAGTDAAERKAKAVALAAERGFRSSNQR